MNELWTFLSGKKTAIAAGLLMASAFISQVLQAQIGMDAPWLGHAVVILDWFGMALGGTGLWHKHAKSKLDVSDSRGHGVGNI